MVQCVGVIGAGQMGSGIAHVMAFNGIKVVLYDLTNEIVENGVSAISKNLERGLSKGKWNQQKCYETLERITRTADLNDLKSCDLVIEAATENKSIKKKIFSDLDKILDSHSIIATNTSSISITELAAVTGRPDKFVGMHFMNPVPVMKLVEGIKGLATSDETFDQVKKLSEKVGKTFVASNDYPGFIVNRILMPMINEAVYAVYEGVASPSDIDSAMKLGTNQPMGPLELADFIGLDTCLSIMEVLYDGLGDSKYRPCPLLRNYVNAGQLGRKVRKGFYQY